MEFDWRSFVAGMVVGSLGLLMIEGIILDALRERVVAWLVSLVGEEVVRRALG